MKRFSSRHGSWAASLGFWFLIVFMTGLLAVPQMVLGGAAPQPSGITLPSGVARVTSVEGVTEYRLANGLRVLWLPDSSKPVITVNITYLVGSRFEGYGETGIAHLLEHLMFKGTPAHPNIPDELTSHGASPNGSTNDDRTNYFETFAASDENLNWALSLEADRMVHSFIAKKDLDSEMTVVRNEYEMGENSPINILDERVMETAYLWHNYGHPTIGARSDIEGVPITRLQAFYHTYYQPDNAVLIVVGKIDEGKTLALIQQKFGPIPMPTRVLPKLYTQEPVQDGERDLALRRVGDIQAVIAAYHIPAAGDPDTVALDMLASILSDPATGRLRQRLVDTKLATSANASVERMHDPGMMTFMAELPKEANLQAAREVLIRVAEGVPQEPVTQDQLNRVRARGLEDIEKIMTDSRFVAMALSEAAAEGDWRLLFWWRDEIKKVTVQDLQRVAGQYLIPSNLTVGLFIPDAKPTRAVIPEAPDYAAMLKNYQGGKAVAAGEQFDATPANIETRTTRTAIGPIKVAYLPKKTRGSLVTATLTIHFGNEQALMNRSEAADLAAALLMRGTTKHDMQQLRDALTAIKTQMRVGGGATEANVMVQTDREHLAAALRLAAEFLQQPTFPEKEFEEVKRGTLANMEAGRSDPQAIATLALRRALSPSYPPGHVNYVPTLDEAIERLKGTTLADVKKFYEDFYGVGAAEMAFVGDFDPKEVTPLLTELFANWKRSTTYQRIPSLYKAITGKTESFNTPDKQNAVFLTATNLALRDDDASYPALVLGNYMLGEGFLNSRLATRIRQKEGLSYGVGSRLIAGSLDKVGSFSAFAICAPQNLPEVATAFQEELKRVLADGFTAKELAEAKSGYLQSRTVARSSDRQLASMLGTYLFDGRDFHWDEKYEKAVRALTVDEVNRAMRQFINPNELIIISAGDLSKKEVKQ